MSHADRRSTLLAQSHLGAIERNPCGGVMLHFGPFSLRLDEGALVEFAHLTAAARAQPDGPASPALPAPDPRGPSH